MFFHLAHLEWMSNHYNQRTSILFIADKNAVKYFMNFHFYLTIL